MNREEFKNECAREFHYTARCFTCGFTWDTETNECVCPNCWGYNVDFEDILIDF